MMDFMGLLNLFNPSKVEGYLRQEAPKADWGLTAVNVGIAIALTTIASLIVSLFGSLISGLFAAVSGNVTGAVTGGAINIAFVFGGAIAAFIAFFLFGFLLHLIASLLGGNGQPEKLLYLMSLIFLAVSPIAAIVTLINFIPCAGCFTWIISLVVAIYELFIFYHALRIVHGLESTNALIALAIWVAIVIIVVGTFFALMIFLGIAGGILGTFAQLAGPAMAPK